MAKQQRKRSSPKPDLVHQDGGLEVNFVNTGSSRRPSIESYADLLAWGQQSGALSATDAQRLSRAAAGRAEDAADVLRRALDLRRRMERIVVELAGQRPPPAADLDAFNAELNAALSARYLAPADSGCQWAAGDGTELDLVLWPTVLAAAELFCSDEHRRLRRCADPSCGAFFVDRSPGGRRKWCDAKACGHRVRSLRHYYHRIKPRKAHFKEERRREAAARRARVLRRLQEEGEPPSS